MRRRIIRQTAACHYLTKPAANKERAEKGGYRVTITTLDSCVHFRTFHHVRQGTLDHVHTRSVGSLECVGLRDRAVIKFEKCGEFYIFGASANNSCPYT